MTTCCCELTTSGRRPSPFTRVLAAGYYDGPTEGIIACGACGRAFAFRLLKWDSDQDLRVFAIGGIQEDFEDLVERWIGANRSEAVTILPPLSTEANGQLVRLLESATSHVVAAEDLLTELLAIQEITPADAIGEVDWFSRLGLHRRSSG